MDLSTTAVDKKLYRQGRQPAASLLLAMLSSAALIACGQDENATSANAVAAQPAQVNPAERESVTSYALQVDLPALASAVIRSSPEGILCGQSVESPVCTAVFTGKTVVTLSQTFEDEQFKFAGWNGDCTGADCSVLMDESRKVRVQYERVLATPPLVIKPQAYVPVCEAYAGPALASLQHAEGLMHEHSSYSDGSPDTIPKTYFDAAKKAGYGFVGSSDHSDTYDKAAYFTVHDSCTLGVTDPASIFEGAGPEKLASTAGTAQQCFASPNADKLLKWESTLTQANKASSANFLAIRGFEWTSDVFGHINVFFSKNFSNAKTDGGFATTMETFWDWFSRSPELPGIGGSATSTVPMGGGSDGLGVFNHPGDKCQFNFADPEPSGTAQSLCNWNRFATTTPAQPLVDGSSNPTGVKFNTNFADIKKNACLAWNCTTMPIAVSVTRLFSMRLWIRVGICLRWAVKMCVFQPKLDSDSGAKWTLIPAQSGH